MILMSFRTCCSYKSTKRESVNRLDPQQVLHGDGNVILYGDCPYR